MRAHLMHRDRDFLNALTAADLQAGRTRGWREVFDLPVALPWNEQVLTQDLELNTLFRAMAAEDEFLFDVARKAILSGLQNDPDTIRYRQEIAKDCLKNPGVIRQMYALTVEAIEAKRKHYISFFGRFPGTTLHEAIEAMQIFVDMLHRLRTIAEEHAGRFESEGFTTLFAMLERELSDEYFARIKRHLLDLRFREGVLLSVELGKDNESINHGLRKAGKRPSLLKRILGKGPPAYTVVIADRDETGAKYLSELRDRGINLVANALAQSSDHIQSFFEMLRAELGFYVGCLNLHGRLASRGETICFPRPEPASARRLRFAGLYDVCLVLTMDRGVVANTIGADGKSLVIITGANQGGKSSFLRAVGLAQLMMQCGMFVGAESFDGELCTALFTHYKREEDPTMKSGKFDEEVGRMSDIVEHITPHSMLLLNESFSSTNEREGSEIARQIVSALLEKGVKIFCVTHLFEFAHGCLERKIENALFLRAERKADGTRTFRLIEGEPLETSYGEDLYREVFAALPGVAKAG